jgi:hypothetical protein
MIGCAGLALSSMIAGVNDRAQAQAFQAIPTIVQGNATIDRNTPGFDIITATAGTDPVIDWSPFEDIFGNALIFLPNGNTAIFQNQVDSGEYTILNRILPSTNNNIVVMDGSVIGRLQTSAGNVPGGTVIFYSPTGLLIGSNATFDIGKLILTSMDLVAFDDVNQILEFVGAPGSTARVEVQAGAQITGIGDDSAVMLAAPQVIQNGLVNVNGTAAYVAAESVTIQYTDGLLDFVIPVGTSVANAIIHNGTTTGPSSTGAGDNHMIYALARAKTNPISMLFGGNLGFAPAASAGIINGEIILSANFNVQGRSVAGANIRDGLIADYQLPEVAADPQADIFVQNANVTSDLLAISTHNASIQAIGATSTFDGNVYVVASDNARIDAPDAGSVIINGNALVSSKVFGAGNPLGPGGLDANGGFASIFAQSGSTITINGATSVNAEAWAGQDGTAYGSATGGQAQIYADGGTVNLNGPVSIFASASHNQSAGYITGGVFAGGLAELIVSGGGSIDVLGNVDIEATANGANLTGALADEGTEANGGRAVIGIFGGGGTINIGGQAKLEGNGVAGSGGAAAIAGANGTAGSADIFIGGAGAIDILGDVTLQASGAGASLTQNGTAGAGLGGSARVSVNGGSVTFGSNFFATAEGESGDGIAGSTGTGGIAGFIVETGMGSIAGDAVISTIGTGGDALLGFGGDGGTGIGGNSFLQANGTLTESAALTVGGGATLNSNGIGGQGGDGNGSGIAAGRGGDGIGGTQTLPNAVDPNFGSGAFIVAVGDNGNISVSGTANAEANGIGGNGGNGGAGQSGGDGGDGKGGNASVGVILFTSSNNLGLGSGNFENIVAKTIGQGGDGGLDGTSNQISGLGGTGSGGVVRSSGNGGDMTALQISLVADGIGGVGAVGGNGVGGFATLRSVFGGSVAATNLNASATGTGGIGNIGSGGLGQGGQEAAIRLTNGNINISGTATLNASGNGGNSNGGNNASGSGGLALIQELDSALQIGTLSMTADATGGPGSQAGRLNIDIINGSAQLGAVTASATGAVSNGQSLITANGGNLAISGTASINVTDGLRFTTINGGSIGGPDLNNPTAEVTIQSGGTVTFDGDNPNFIAFSTDSLSITSAELDLINGAVVGANILSLTSIDTTNPMIIGAISDENGYTLTLEELDKIEIDGGSASIFAPEIIGQGPNDPDLILRALDIFGSQDNGVASVTIATPGTARIEGQVRYLDAGPNDVFDLFAGQRLEIVTPGGIGIVDTAGNPTGQLFLGSPYIWVADADTIADLQTDLNFTGRDERLATTFAGSDDPLGYLRAGSISIGVSNSLLVRNTGTADEPGGILVGSGGLSIFGAEGSNGTSGPIEVFAYGRQQNPDGSFTAGEAFYDLVNFNRAGTSRTEYTTGSQFNDCDIIAGNCGSTEETPPVNNPAVVEAPISSVSTIPPTEAESDAEFGADFPGLVEAPLLSDDPLLEDPVSSGGDSALYSIGDEDEAEDEDDGTPEESDGE